MRAAMAVMVWALAAQAAVTVEGLQVEYRKTPLGIDVERPRFGWQMAATAGERGVEQAAYQIVVKDEKGAPAWDSGVVKSGDSVGIVYGGKALAAATRYVWTVSVWDGVGVKRAGTSWFETGLMGGSWDGAKWIGGGDGDLVLYAPYLAIFDVSYRLTIAPGSARASFVYGANDSRLMDRNKNIYQLENKRNGSYIQVELDVAGVEGGGKAKLKVYRVGYRPGDRAEEPLKVFEVAGDVIDAGNRHGEHLIELKSAFGQLTVTVDGKASLAAVGAAAAPAGPGGGFGRVAPNGVNLNPMGAGGNYLPFGMLCEMGFAMEAGQRATVRALKVSNNRAPNNVLYAGEERRELDGGASGLFEVKDPSKGAAPMVRRTFEAAKAVKRARLYVTARGIYEVFLNGQRVSDDRYNPGLTQYNVTHLYQSYDVTAMVRAGKNAIGAVMSEGWWSGLLSFGTIWNHFGDRQSLLAKLVLTYADGSTETVVSDERWRFFGAGPVVYASLDFGEVYDARREAAVAGWTTAAYGDAAWKPAVEVKLEGTAFAGTEMGRMGAPGAPFHFEKLRLVGQIGESAGVFKVLKARSVKEVRPGVFVYDMGQNIVGVPRIKVAAGRAGQRVTLRFAEMVYPDLKESGGNVGMLMTENYRAALSQDVYVMKAGAQVIEPRFTSHGYQLVEVTGVEKALPLEAVEGVVTSSVRALTADYRTSNERVNRLWSNLVWSNIDNFLTIPTDCPQRNERMGWSGDINVFSRTATYVSMADQFLARHLRAMRDTQGANGRFADVAPVGGGFGGVLWGSAGIVVPWEAYRQYRDVGLLEEHWAAMVAYMDYLEGTVDAKTGLSSDAALGDWLGPQNNALGSAYLATAYHAYDLGIMAEAAGVLGKTAEAARYKALYEKRKAFFNATFVNAEKRTVGLIGGGRGMFGGGGARGGTPPAAPQMKVADTQTSYAVGLGMGLFSDELRPAMIERLAEAVERENKDDGGVVRPKYSLMTGFIGTAWISKALSEAGRVDLAYRLLQNRQYPSWLYAIDQGATTIWERLNGYTVENGFGGNNSMNSFNHYSFGAVGQWMMAHSLGIERGEAGFRRFVLQPEPDATGGMTSAAGHYDSVYGRIESGWKVQGKTLTYAAVVPANTTATLYLPASERTVVKEGGQAVSAVKGVRFVKKEAGKAVYELKSGRYLFTAEME